MIFGLIYPELLTVVDEGASVGTAVEVVGTTDGVEFVSSLHVFSTLEVVSVACSSVVP